MKRLSALTAVLLLTAFTAVGCQRYMHDDGWVTLIDGKKGLENFDRIGDANWRGHHDYIVADSGKGGYLVSKKSYKDFALRVEFWADHTTNSGIHIRSADSKKIASTSSYEINIFDQGPNPVYATGGVPNFAMIRPGAYKAGGRWNVYEIYAIGPEITVKLNGVVTVAFNNSQFKEGPIALQYGAGVKDTRGGTIRWRSVRIKEL